MAKRKTNIIGLTFKCEDCGQTFAIGKNGTWQDRIKQVSKAVKEITHG